MIRNRILAVIFTFTLLPLAFAVPTPAIAQQPQYQPSIGQAGKDVIWVPTPAELIQALYDLAKVSPSDYVIDLGSGDGPWVIAAAKRGARALGVEFNPDMVELARSRAKREGVSDKASFIQGDIFEADFSQASVVTMYLLPDLNMKLRPKILEMKPGTRVLTNSFTMEDWDPDQSVSVEGRTGYMWIVPAMVAGTWTWQTPSGPAEVSLRQNFQKIEGTLKMNGKDLPLQNAKLEGARISFAAGENQASTREYAGTINGNAISGTSRVGTGPEAKWTAERRATR
jgi:SAM-dependent methyltransferase